jgi:hypothetical protein
MATHKKRPQEESDDHGVNVTSSQAGKRPRVDEQQAVAETRSTRPTLKHVEPAVQVLRHRLRVLSEDLGRVREESHAVEA